MKLFPRRDNSVNGILHDKKAFAKNPNSSMLDMRHPLSPGSVPRYSFYTRSIVLFQFHIIRILNWASLSKICYRVICRIAVDVVNSRNGKLTMYIEPSQPMSKVENTIDKYLNIRVMRRSVPTSDTTCPTTVPRFVLHEIGLPPEYARLWVIYKLLFQVFLGKFVSHFHNQKIKGQKRGVEAVSDLLRKSELLQSFGMNSTPRHALCN